MSEIYDNARRVLDMAADAAIRSGRAAEDVMVLAASKMNGRENIREAYRAGFRLFGENRAQELRDKLAENAYEGAEVHFIGHLQKNKLKYAVGAVSLIQSADSVELMSAISERAKLLGIRQDILIEVNAGREPQKSGALPEALPELLEFAAECGGLRVAGLMTIPPIEADPEKNIRYFEKMAKLFVDIKGKKYDNVTMNILSMGMSRDFEAAIACGANLVRVGSLVFGERQYR